MIIDRDMTPLSCLSQEVLPETPIGLCNSQKSGVNRTCRAPPGIGGAVRCHAESGGATRLDCQWTKARGVDPSQGVLHPVIKDLYLALEARAILVGFFSHLHWGRPINSVYSPLKSLFIW